MSLYIFSSLCIVFFLLMIRRPPRSTRTDTLFPYTTLFRSEKYEQYTLCISARVPHRRTRLCEGIVRRFSVRRLPKHRQQRSPAGSCPASRFLADGCRIIQVGATSQAHQQPLLRGGPLLLRFRTACVQGAQSGHPDRKSTRLNSSH